MKKSRCIGFVCYFLVVIICLFSLFILGEKKGIFYSYTSAANRVEAEKTNSQLQLLNGETVLLQDLSGVNISVIQNAEFEIELYELLVAFATGNELIVAATKNSFAEIFMGDYSTEHIAALRELVAVAKRFSLDIENSVLEYLSACEKILFSVQDMAFRIDSFFCEYSSQDLYLVKGFLLEIAALGNYDRQLLLEHENKLDESISKIGEWLGRIDFLERFYFALSKESIDDIDKNDIDVIYVAIDMYETLPKADRKRCEYMRQFFDKVIEQVNSLKFFKKIRK